MKLENFSFRDKFDILLEKRFIGVAELRSIILYGKSQMINAYHQENFRREFRDEILCYISPKYLDMEIRALQKPCFRTKFWAEKLFWCFHPLDFA